MSVPWRLDAVEDSTGEIQYYRIMAEDYRVAIISAERPQMARTVAAADALLRTVERLCELCQKVSKEEGVWIDVHQAQEFAASIRNGGGQS